MKSKKTFSLPLGVIIVGIIAIICIVLYVFRMNGNTTNKQDIYKSNNSMFSDSELKSVDKNEDYKRKNKLKMKDLNIGDIYCGMKLEDMISVLGECDNIYESTLTEDLNYKTYRYDNYDIIIDIDKDKEVIKALTYEGNDFENKKGIKRGSSISEVISSYHSEKNIARYENNQGTYKVLYNSNDFFDYLYNNQTEDKSFGYIYEYQEETYAIEYMEDGMKLRFEFLEDKVNRIVMSYK